jgi:SWI/SNF-related matrix-associated actin-dependent regulator of chromatin subfamily B protein 1
MSYHSVIMKSIQDQLSDFKAHSTLFADMETDQGAGSEVVEVGIDEDEDLFCVGDLSEEDLQWWAAWRRRLRSGRKARKRKVGAPKTGNVEEKPLDASSITIDEEKMEDDKRIVIRVGHSGWLGTSD